MKVNIDTKESFENLTLTQCASKLKALDGVKDAVSEYESNLVRRFEDLCKEKTGLEFKRTAGQSPNHVPKEEWEKGDILICTRSDDECVTTGVEYEFVEFDSWGDIVVIDDDGDEYDPDATFEFVRRP